MPTTMQAIFRTSLHYHGKEHIILVILFFIFVYVPCCFHLAELPIIFGTSEIRGVKSTAFETEVANRIQGKILSRFAQLSVD